MISFVRFAYESFIRITTRRLENSDLHYTVVTSSTSSPIQPLGPPLKATKLYLWRLATFFTLKRSRLNSDGFGYRWEQWTNGDRRPSQQHLIAGFWKRKLSVQRYQYALCGGIIHSQIFTSSWSCLNITGPTGTVEGSLWSLVPGTRV